MLPLVLKLMFESGKDRSGDFQDKTAQSLACQAKPAKWFPRGDESVNMSEDILS